MSCNINKNKLILLRRKPIFTNFMVQTETIENDVCRMLARLAAEYGVRHVVVSPGTRSAPLAVVFHRSGNFRMHTVIDERCAAFMALGMALATDSPVILICTSGSALMNYGPALAEAFYRRVPVIAISADRPAHWVDQLDSQTMRQHGALTAVVRKSVDIPVAAARDGQLFSKANREVNEAFTAAISGRRGPVHINVQLDVPLTHMTSEPPALEPHLICSVCPEASTAAFSDIVASLAGKKVMIVCGDTTPEEQSALAGTIPNIPILSEAQSNIPTGFNIGSFDRFLSDDKALRPEVIITVGGSLVSARLKRYLRSIKGLRHISLGFDDNAADTFGCLDTRLECDPAPFISALADNNADAHFAELWAEFYSKSQSKTAEIVCHNPVTAVIAAIAENFSGDVHISNGSAIRYAEMINWQQSSVACNRGISGIDGCTSTALGSAIASQIPTMLITGDMSAAYDIGALGAATPPNGFRIAVLDNDGGDIFRNISATSALPELDRYFVAKPCLPLRQLAKAYGYGYFEYDCSAPDSSVLDRFINNETAAILRIIIDPKYTAKML